MNLPKLSLQWSTQKLIDNLFEWGRQIESADKQNRKTNGDVELAGNQALILTDTVTGARTKITIASGSLTLTAL